MRLKISLLKSPHLISISSSDQWLKGIATNISQDNQTEANISGELTLKTDTAGFIHALGHVTASAKLSCDRCGQDVTAPLSCDVKASFRPPYSGQAPKETTLSLEDLDVYFIENGEIDLEALVNDALQCAIPSHILCEDLGGKSCAGLTEDPSDNVNAESSWSHSPFAGLKSFK
jgi:uncharacterized metal-binding protein YceD (DUF177 family)